ncbi:hypothetical protein AB0F15_40625 [Amycolatopsis sp. NPDC026612]|uniref:hypothetical protein n=1 Tax=Amycolatopsis sp. NPDC026612 TaxID=3155466 RepID=UPI003405E39C
MLGHVDRTGSSDGCHPARQRNTGCARLGGLPVLRGLRRDPAVQEANRLSDGNPARFRHTLAEVLVDLNIALWRARRGPEAIEVGTAALDLYRAMRAENPGVFDAQLATVLMNLATDLNSAGRQSESASLTEEAIAILRGLGSSVSAERSEALPLALNNAALSRFTTSDSDAALPLAEEAVAILTRLDSTRLDSTPALPCRASCCSRRATAVPSS